jgi:hypothetical protein
LATWLPGNSSCFLKRSSACSWDVIEDSIASVRRGVRDSGFFLGCTCNTNGQRGGWFRMTH